MGSFLIIHPVTRKASCLHSEKKHLNVGSPTLKQMALKCDSVSFFQRQRGKPIVSIWQSVMWLCYDLNLPTAEHKNLFPSVCFLSPLLGFSVCFWFSKTEWKGNFSWQVQWLVEKAPLVTTLLGIISLLIVLHMEVLEKVSTRLSGSLSFSRLPPLSNFFFIFAIPKPPPRSLPSL